MHSRCNVTTICADGYEVGVPATPSSDAVCVGAGVSEGVTIGSASAAFVVIVAAVVAFRYRRRPRPVLDAGSSRGQQHSTLYINESFGAVERLPNERCAPSTMACSDSTMHEAAPAERYATAVHRNSVQSGVGGSSSPSAYAVALHRQSLLKIAATGVKAAGDEVSVTPGRQRLSSGEGPHYSEALPSPAVTAATTDSSGRIVYDAAVSTDNSAYSTVLGKSVEYSVIDKWPKSGNTDTKEVLEPECHAMAHSVGARTYGNVKSQRSCRRPALQQRDSRRTFSP